MTELSRRQLIGSATLTGAALLTNCAAAQEQEQNHGHMHDHGASQTADVKPRLAFFTPEEAQFVSAAVDRLIPADEQWGGALAADVPTYIDRQLAGPYGSGARMYLKGPWDPDATPQQGYQLRHSPADLYRTGIDETRNAVRQGYANREFWSLADEEKDRVLTALEHGDLELASVPGAVFFETLLANTIEGFLSDPVYGGNKDMIGWRMVGFPGAYAQYAGLVDKHNLRFTRPPISIANANIHEHHDDMSRG